MTAGYADDSNDESQGPVDMYDTTAASESVSPTARPCASSLPVVPVVPGTGKWHALTIFAGAILIVTFFLPLDRPIYQRSSNTPARFLGQLIQDADGIPRVFQSFRGLAKLTVRFTMAALPQIWGVLIMLISVASLLDLRRLRGVLQTIGILLALPIAAAWTVCAGRLMSSFLRNPRFDVQSLCWLATLIAVFVIPVGGLLYALLAYRRRGWAYLYHGFVGAGSPVAMLLIVHFFAMMDRGGLPYSGLTGVTITSLACCLLFFSRVGEARALTGLTWRRTLWHLFTLRLHKTLRTLGLCPGCGYNLYGLRERRCPECGRPFTFEEVGATPESLGFSGELPTTSSRDALTTVLPEGP
jgi:hypothetical protein